MTPERARAIYDEHEAKWAATSYSRIVASILAACAEERSAALTEAMELCERHVRQQQANKPMDDRSHFYMVGAMDCAVAIKRLRDKP